MDHSISKSVDHALADHFGESKLPCEQQTD
jgi:hypothetical protein